MSLYSQGYSLNQYIVFLTLVRQELDSHSLSPSLFSSGRSPRCRVGRLSFHCSALQLASQVLLLAFPIGMKFVCFFLRQESRFNKQELLLMYFSLRHLIRPHKLHCSFLCTDVPQDSNMTFISSLVGHSLLGIMLNLCCCLSFLFLHRITIYTLSNYLHGLILILSYLRTQ